MKDKDFENIIQFVNVSGGFMPANEKCEELLENTYQGEIVNMIDCTARDLKFHRCYMGLLGYIYDYLPRAFKKQLPKNKFYKWLKHLKGEYKVIFEFKNGEKFIEYESISFGNMSQARFKTYVKEQLPFIYEEVIAEFYQDDIYDGIINTIEDEYKIFMAKLN